jgi:hypothetical protein
LNVRPDPFGPLTPTAKPGERVYCWQFKGYEELFKVMIGWLVSVSATVGVSCSVEIEVIRSNKGRSKSAMNIKISTRSGSQDQRRSGSKIRVRSHIPTRGRSGSREIGVTHSNMFECET